MDDLIANFTAITSADPQRAQQYLALTENNLEQAIQLYFDSDGADMGATLPQSTASQPPPQARSRSRPGYSENADGSVTIDSDAEMDEDDEDFGGAALGGGATSAAQDLGGPSYEDDEAMARRLQEEAYGAGGVPGAEDVRAPMARTTETLIGPDANWGGAGGGDGNMSAAIAEQLAARNRRPAGRPGIFNQQSVWDEDTADPEVRRRNLARATGGASEASAKSNLLAQLFSPPTDLISPLSWTDAREEGKEQERWIMVNVQDPSIFDCQALNRDIWKNAQVKETIQENFIFMQYSKDDPRGGQYINYYFHARDSDDAYPHIAIVDPRTGEQVKVWSGTPIPKPHEFVQDVHEFLDRYSLNAFAKNPVANRKPQKKGKEVERMTEEEMLEMALQNSLRNGAASGSKDEDPDALTRGDTADKGKAPADVMDTVDMGEPISGETEPSSSAAASPWSLIASDKPHVEPTDPASTTRIQFKWSGGRQIRRFAVTDPVRRIYEWLKTTPFEGKDGVEFELISMSKNLMASLDQTIDEAGLKNGTVMVEYLDS